MSPLLLFCRATKLVLGRGANFDPNYLSPVPSHPSGRQHLRSNGARTAERDAVAIRVPARERSIACGPVILGDAYRLSRGSPGARESAFPRERIEADRNELEFAGRRW